MAIPTAIFEIAPHKSSLYGHNSQQHEGYNVYTHLTICSPDFNSKSGNEDSNDDFKIHSGNAELIRAALLQLWQQRREKLPY